MRAHWLAWVAFGVAAAMACGEDTGETPVRGDDLSILIRLHNSAGVPDSIIDRAMAETSRIFGAAGIKVAWVKCLFSGRPAPVPLDPCNETDEPLAFTLSVQTIRHSRGASEMGFALPFAANGNHAAVWYQRIYAVAESDLHVRVDWVLACAMAHEIAHLILGSTAHGDGIMRPRWTRRELRMIRQRQLKFHRSEASKLRTCLAMRVERRAALKSAAGAHAVPVTR